MPRGVLFALFVSAFIAIAGCSCGDDDDDSSSGDDDGGPVEAVDAFVGLVANAVADHGVESGWQAIVFEQPLAASDEVAPAIADEPEASPGDDDNPDAPPAETAKSAKADGDRWFAFVDLDPFAQFSHPVLYIYADPASGELTVEEQSWWPEVNGTSIYLSDKTLLRVYASVTPASESQSAPSDAMESFGRVLVALTLDQSANTATMRFAVEASSIPSGATVLNAVVDNDRSGSWAEGARGSEWIAQNAAIDTASAAEGWVWTAAASLGLDASNKFGFENWTRVALDAGDVSGTWDGSGDHSAVGDYYFNFLPWGGPGYGEDDDPATALGPDEPAMTPIEMSSIPPKVEGLATCSPDGASIPIERKALVMNLGDAPGKSWMQRNGMRAKMGFDLILGDGAATLLDRPTSAEAFTAIENFLAGMKCMDELWIYITGHGESGQGAIHVANGDGWVEPWRVGQKLNAHTNCPKVMEYSKNECRQAGYCNLNMVVQSCYSGWWRENAGTNGLRRWGVNVLTSASKDKTSYGTADGDGSYVSNMFWNSYLDNEADELANGGNADGHVSPEEAMNYAASKYEGTGSDSNYSKGANCNCHCEERGWLWADPLWDLRYYEDKAEPPYLGYMDIDFYGIRQTETGYEVEITYAEDLNEEGASDEFIEYYAVFDASTDWTNETADSPTYGGDVVYIVSYQFGSYGMFRFDRSLGAWAATATTATFAIDGNVLTMSIDQAESALEIDEPVTWRAAVWSRDPSDQSFGDTTDPGDFTPEADVISCVL